MFSGIQEKSFLAVVLLVLVGGLIYSNTLNVPFYFDDIDNVKNPALRVEKISFDEFSEVISSARLRTRPVSNASFALNYYFGGYRVQGYHLVNICIHLLAGVFLFFLSKLTLALPVNNNLGSLMLRQAKYSEAVVYFSKALCIAPENKLAAENLGWGQKQLELSRGKKSSPGVDE